MADDHPPDPLPARKGEEIVSEGHPFDYAQGRLSDARPFAGLRTGAGASPLCTPQFDEFVIGSCGLHSQHIISGTQAAGQYAGLESSPV